MASVGATAEEAFVVIGARRAAPAAAGAELAKAEGRYPPRPPLGRTETEEEKDADAKLADTLACNRRAVDHDEIAGAAALPPQEDLPAKDEAEAKLKLKLHER